MVMPMDQCPEETKAFTAKSAKKIKSEIQKLLIHFAFLGVLGVLASWRLLGVFLFHLVENLHAHQVVQLFEPDLQIRAIHYDVLANDF